MDFKTGGATRQKSKGCTALKSKRIERSSRLFLAARGGSERADLPRGASRHRLVRCLPLLSAFVTPRSASNRKGTDLGANRR
jgi:hypothetical protein